MIRIEIELKTILSATDDHSYGLGALVLMSRLRWGCSHGAPLCRCWFPHRYISFPVILRLQLLLHVVFDEPTALDELRSLVGEVAGEQQPVAGLHLVGEPHEEQRIAGQSKGHPAADNFRTLLHICDGCYWKTPVSYWTPEMRAHQILPELLALQVVDGFPCEGPGHGSASVSVFLLEENCLVFVVSV